MTIETVKEINKLMETEQTTEKQLGRHIVAAITAIQKEIDKREAIVLRLTKKAADAENDAESLRESIRGLQEQISKLKGND